MVPWDDFRLVKAIAEARSLTGASALLGLNHSTVFRRLGELEERLAVPLFERHRSGHGLTHPDPRGSPRVRAVLDFAAGAISRLRPLLEGERPCGGRARTGSGSGIADRGQPHYASALGAVHRNDAMSETANAMPKALQEAEAAWRRLPVLG